MEPDFDFDDRDKFLGILLRGTVLEVRTFLDSVGSSAKNLVNLPLKRNPCDKTTAAKERVLFPDYLDMVELSVFIAFGQTCRPLLELLIEYDGDILARNSKNYNILHIGVSHIAMFWTEHRYHEMEAGFDIFKWILAKIEKSDLKRLFEQENNDGLRPLEMCTIMPAYILFPFFCNIEGVYRWKIEEDLLHDLVLYDVDEYEKGGRENSPLEMLENVTEKAIECDWVRKSMKSPIIVNWVKIKYGRFKWFLGFPQYFEFYSQSHLLTVCGGIIWNFRPSRKI